MPEIKFTNDKADRWLSRISKRVGKLTVEDRECFLTIQSLRAAGEKLNPKWERILFDLGRKV
jgi:hypothetical protein